MLKAEFSSKFQPKQFMFLRVPFFLNLIITRLKTNKNPFSPPSTLEILEKQWCFFLLIARGTWNWTKFNLTVEMDFLYSQRKFGQFIELWIETKPAADHMYLPEAS